MSSYALYGINFYSDALENLERYLKKYPADTNVMYAHYLIAIIHYEQISDEQKDLKETRRHKFRSNKITSYHLFEKYNIDEISIDELKT